MNNRYRTKIHKPLPYRHISYTYVHFCIYMSYTCTQMYRHEHSQPYITTYALLLHAYPDVCCIPLSATVPLCFHFVLLVMTVISVRC